METALMDARGRIAMANPEIWHQITYCKRL
jgi:hypothetical protein